jgi:hypothetical protein
MPATHFLCPDGEQITIDECINKGCRMAWALPAGRCLSVRTLRAIAEQRTWGGKPSTTQLLKGVREAYLEITTDYPIDPQGALFRVHGSKGHGYLDQFVDGNELGEERLHDEISSGMFDFYDTATATLYDDKFSGSYKIMKAMGLHQVTVPTGEVYKTNCKSGKKGDPKYRKEWREGGYRDCLDWAIQLNDYRIKLESLGFPVKQMVIECIARDGGCYIALNRGVEQNGVLIPINRISDHWIKRYMATKAAALHKALDTGELPPPCKPRQTWHGKKCEKYCNVRETCKSLAEYKSVVSF